MLSYQHSYHAGGPADVHKHVALCLLLGHLAKKDKAYCVLDLYAGEGDYSLQAFAAQKTNEYQDGIARVWNAPHPPASVQGYLAQLRRLNPDGELRRYPGSPALARGYMRDDDRLVLNELHSTAYPALGRWARKDARIGVHKRDGLEALVGLTPPSIKRGLMLIDPSYEVKTEYAAVPEKLAQAFKKWREGIYVIWYPILAETRHRALLDGIVSGIEADILACELSLAPVKRGEKISGLRGTGIIVINPPWQFDAAMTEAGAWLSRVMQQKKHSVAWLKRNDAEA
jgi:23S rRNA (adenine2030-N6)-methyltransferase